MTRPIATAILAGLLWAVFLWCFVVLVSLEG